MWIIHVKKDNLDVCIYIYVYVYICVYIYFKLNYWNWINKTYDSLEASDDFIKK